MFWECVCGGIDEGGISPSIELHRALNPIHDSGRVSRNHCILGQNGNETWQWLLIYRRVLQENWHRLLCGVLIPPPTCPQGCSDTNPANQGGQNLHLPAWQRCGGACLQSPGVQRLPQNCDPPTLENFLHLCPTSITGHAQSYHHTTICPPFGQVHTQDTCSLTVRVCFHPHKTPDDWLLLNPPQVKHLPRIGLWSPWPWFQLLTWSVWRNIQWLLPFVTNPLHWAMCTNPPSTIKRSVMPWLLPSFYWNHKCFPWGGFRSSRSFGINHQYATRINPN